MTRAWTWIGLMLSLSAGVSSAAETITISQKGKQFSPDDIEIAVGTTVHILNDDRVLHHVYVESPGFNYDSGEQPPSHRISITFTQRGTFEVKCDIHPKMLLRVVVR